MENIDNEKIALPDQTGCNNGEDGYGYEYLGSNIAEQDIEDETVAAVSRKRGRPKKYIVNETIAEKRGRGRPRGSSNRTSELGSDDGNFIPYVVRIQRGEDIVEKVMSFIQMGVQAICILSASGPISIVNLHRRCSGQNVTRYEGYFELLTLKGSHGDVGGVHNDMLKLSVSLAYSDGQVFGGTVCGCLIAAAPVQLIMGIIKHSPKKRIPKKRNINPPTPAIMSRNAKSLIAPTPNNLDSEDSTMSPTLGYEVIEDNKSVEHHHASQERSYKNDLQLLNQSEDHHVSPEKLDQITSESSDHASGGTLSDDDHGGAKES